MYNEKSLLIPFWRQEEEQKVCYFEREKLFGAILSLTNWEQITLLLLTIERLLCENPWYDSEKVLHIHLFGPLKCWKCPPFLQKMHILEATTFFSFSSEWHYS